MTGGTTEAGHEDTPWDQAADPGWATTVDAWEWNRLNGRWIKQGPCPSCRGLMYVELGLTDLAETEKAQVYAECNCGFTHSDHEGGCGRSAMVGGPS